MNSNETNPHRVSSLTVMRFVARYWAGVPWRFTGMIVGVIAGILVEVQIPGFAAEVVIAVQAMMSDAGSDGDDTAAWQAITNLVLLFVILFTIKQLYFRNWMHLASTVMKRMLDDGFTRVQLFSTDWHTNHFAGSTQRKITRGMWAYDTLADTVVVDLGPAVGLLFGFSIAMALRDPWLGLFFASGISVFLIVSIYLSLAYVAPANQRSNDADTAVGGALADAITCNSVVKSFGSEASETQRFDEVSNHWRLSARRAWTRSMDAGAVQSVMLVLLLWGLLAVAMSLSNRPGMQVQDIVYVITTYLLVNGYLRNIGWQIRNMQRSINELDDLVQISNETPQIADAVHARSFHPAGGSVSFKNVQFGYANQPNDLFTDLNVEIRAGEKVALVGESGSGKSTFVKLLLRLYDIDKGAISVDEQNISEVAQASLRRAISLVPQEPILFHRSLAENIGYARSDASREEIIAAARQAHADEFIARLDEGYDTLVGERGIKLSGGERQRVAIARAILADAPLLVLDEATSSLDSLTEQLIQDALARLMQERTAIIIAHRLSTVRSVDRLLVFDQGQIIEQGNHEELMRIPNGHYRRLVEMQSFSDAA